MTQKERILTMLEQAGDQGVTGNQFYAACLPRFAARIKELRDEGYDITTRRIDGNHFLYTLHPKEGVLNGEGRLASKAWPRKTGTGYECSPSDGAAVNSSVTGSDVKPGYPHPEGTPGQAYQDHGRAGEVIHASPVPRLVEVEPVDSSGPSYYDTESEHDWGGE